MFNKTYGIHNTPVGYACSTHLDDAVTCVKWKNDIWLLCYTHVYISRVALTVKLRPGLYQPTCCTPINSTVLLRPASNTRQWSPVFQVWACITVPRIRLYAMKKYKNVMHQYSLQTAARLEGRLAWRVAQHTRVRRDKPMYGWLSKIDNQVIDESSVISLISMFTESTLHEPVHRSPQGHITYNISCLLWRKC
jgi:hypothetical protein